MRKRWADAGLEEDHDDLAEEGAQVDDLPAEIDQVAAKLVQPVGEEVDVPRRGGSTMFAFTTLNSSA